jgi:glutamyl-tRNA synthetase
MPKRRPSLTKPPVLPLRSTGARSSTALTAALKDATGRKGKTLFLPLRQALTGMDHGPDMKALLLLIGQDESVARLRTGAA